MEVAKSDSTYYSALLERIKLILAQKSLKMSELCVKIGTAPSFFSKPRDFSVFKILKICEIFPDIRMEWLLLGEGEMSVSRKLCDEVSFFKRINEFMTFKDINATKFCQKINKSPGYFGKPREVGFLTVIKIKLNFPDINLNWLLYGAGSMIYTSQEQSSTLPASKFIDELMSILKEKDKRIDEVVESYLLIQKSIQEYKEDKEFLKKIIDQKDREIDTFRKLVEELNTLHGALEKNHN